MSIPRTLHLPPPAQDSVAAGRLILRDGSTATIRIARPSDREPLAAFFHRLSAESRYRRFFTAAEPTRALVETWCDDTNPRAGLSLVVTRTVAGESRIIAIGTYAARQPSTAEVAFAVDDEFHGKGLGTLLLERLALVAFRHGFRRFWALTLPENTPMLDVFRDSGFPVESRLERGEVEIDLSVEPTGASVSFAETRDRVATEASLVPLLRPKSVAVIGASRSPAKLGHRILEALAKASFTGTIYPVNPGGASVRGFRAYASIRDVPEAVDLALIAVPRDRVLQVVDDCAARGVRALTVITAGFAEAGAAGSALQQELVDRVRDYGMRMVGPNCMGLINTDPAVQLNASFSPVFPPAGPVALSSQSGALGLAIVALAETRQLGLSTFVSVGNKADVSGNDLLQYLEGDPHTKVILLYLESFGNPRRFARIARRVARTKPVVVIKAGRTRVGRRAAGSHTAAIATSDAAVEALFRQTGVIRADTLEEMFDLAACLSGQPLPRGRRVAIVTNAGGPGILSADACEASGLQVPEFSAALGTRLAAFLPPTAAISNPVDMIASAGPDDFGRAVETILTSDEIDTLIVLYTPIDRSSSAAVIEHVKRGIGAARAYGVADKPVMACLVGTDGRVQPLHLAGETIPVYAFPEVAARVLGKVAAYAEWLREPPSPVPDLDAIEPGAAREICRRAIQERGEGWLSAEDTRRVLSAFNLPVPPGGVAASADEAVRVARSIGYPVAVKLASRVIVHKSDVGAVHLDVGDDEGVRRAFESIERSIPAEAMQGVAVQPMLRGGVELMVGVSEDPQFGPLIGFGLGGIHVEILGDVQFRVTPITERDADEMIREIRGYPLLQGYRGHPPADIGALRDLLLRTSRLVEELPEVTELDLNPVFALAPGSGCRIADARIRVADPSAHQPARYPTTPQPA